MVSPYEIFERLRFWFTADRLGPDMPLTHWRLYFKSSMRRLCESKFQYFGPKAEFRPGAYAEACTKISIGRRVVIRPGTFLYADPTENGGSILIEDDVLIGSGVHMYTNNHKFSDPNKTIYEQGYPSPTPMDSIVLKRGCWIGAGSIILPGVEIGENSVIGAGAIVTKSIPSFVVAVGNPARVIKSIKL